MTIRVSEKWVVGVDGDIVAIVPRDSQIPVAFVNLAVDESAETITRRAGLLAAAPALLDALRDAEAYIVNEYGRKLWHEHFSWDRDQAHAAAVANPPQVVLTIRAAIAEATGGMP